MFRLAGVVTLVCALFSLPLASSLSPKDGAGTVKFGVREARGTDLDSAIKSGEVVVFYDGLCPVCLQAERALIAVGAHIVKVPIENYESSLRERTGVSSAPSVWVKGKFVGGYNDGPEAWQGVKPMIASGRMQQMLGLGQEL